jgi:hypothetical protein
MPPWPSSLARAVVAVRTSAAQVSRCRLARMLLTSRACRTRAAYSGSSPDVWRWRASSIHSRLFRSIPSQLFRVLAAARRPRARRPAAQALAPSAYLPAVRTPTTRAERRRRMQLERLRVPGQPQKILAAPEDSTRAEPPAQVAKTRCRSADTASATGVDRPTDRIIGSGCVPICATVVRHVCSC